MNEKKKGFNLFPEYVWMIFVGMLLAILILTNVIPGHADEVSPTPTVTPVPTSALDPTDACLPIYIMGQTYMLFDEDSSTVLSYFQQYDNDLITRDELLELAYFSRVYQLDNDNSAFFRDVKIALTQLRSQFKGFFVDLIDVGAAKGAYESLYAAVSEVGVPISQGYGEYSTNRVLYMANGVFIDVPIWVWNTALPTPTEAPELETVGFEFYSRPYNSYSWDYRIGYYYVELEGYGFNVPVSVPEGTSAFLSAVSSYSVSNPWSNFVFMQRNSITSNYLLCYFSGNVTKVYIYQVGETNYSIDYIKANIVPHEFEVSSNSVSLGSNGRLLFDSSVGLYNFSFYGSSDNFGFTGFYYFDVPAYKLFSGSYSNTSSFFVQNDSGSSNPLVIAYGYGLTSDVAPTSMLTPTPTLSPTPVPLPTAGESIHVILPTGTPSPTPPFSVPGGSDGSSGSDSPGSIGSGLSSGQTSGVLQAWNMYVSDNPAMLFLTSTFQSLPQELLYPLYILLFILLLLAVIRLFVHFSGG